MVLDHSRSEADVTHWVPLEAKLLQAQAMMCSSKTPEAARRLRDCAGLCEDMLGVEHPWTVRARMLEGAAAIELGWHERALDVLERLRALSINSGSLGWKVHVDIAIALGQAYSGLGRGGAAREIYQEVLSGYDRAATSAQRRSLGDPRYIIELIQALADSHAEEGNWKDALPLHRRVLLFAENLAGGDVTADSIDATLKVVEDHRHLSTLADVLPQLVDLHLRFLDPLGHNNLLARKLKSTLADVHFELGSAQDAFELYADILPSADTFLDPEALAIKLKQARCLRDMGQLVRAETMLVDVFAESTMVYDENDPRVREVEAELEALAKAAQS
jgi:hypothetical protein